MEALGRQLILEYYGCPAERLNDASFVEEVMVAAAESMGAHIVCVNFHQFNPHGVSGAVVISESHLTIHTWPEYGYAAVDVFTCGTVIDPWEAHAFLKERFGATRESTVEFRRGCFDVAPGTLPSAYGVTREDLDK
ncbi:S-adenosylmethionine decarboxylase proenzyme [Lujinxingia vulgaris]|uniref:S-adenosylmethionine decarboxylase proenzyme n=1 Tax=Lujinxingia vulgaris TaxID=2600176 RepID=A0A5C6X8B8_9DELT|nr:adenosylmethionine decarboxylase [Lujinxingia vulgaris]TXD35373.1 S-adenosylmethionine decarboxylase proenzyme [Lujinxingia vulgaris]